ncbi:MAG: hypothetical protein HYW78_02435 [Parcubacteria group bacterium]|nr:hypothetical protein [Parcubacteria group bacterium]
MREKRTIIILMKKPYLKKIGDVSIFKVWRVDGNYIRSKIDEEFTNCGQHYLFKFIPKYELWIDYEAHPGETDYYINHLIIENRLMEAGTGYGQALNVATLIEQRERDKNREIQLLKKRNLHHVPKQVYIKRIKSSTKNFKIWLVNGELVRDLYYINFTEGGHEKVYSFVPKGEVWLDDDISRKEIQFVLIHELHERYHMAHGLPYYKAHRYASEVEYAARRRPTTTQKKLRLEIKKNEEII